MASVAMLSGRRAGHITTCAKAKQPPAFFPLRSHAYPKVKKQRKTLLPTPLFRPRNENQEAFRELLMHPKPDILIVTGPAGTSKTFGATMCGLEQLIQGNIQKLVLTRPTIPTEEEENLGFLPGKMSDKLMVWMLPVMDALQHSLPQEEIDYLLKSNKIEFCSLCHIRGRTFRDAFVIIDECQNMTPSQMLTMLTRIGEKSKFVFTGDLSQVDRKNNNSGLIDFVHKYQRYQQSTTTLDDDALQDEYRSFIHLFQFDFYDIVRHPAIQYILEIYE